MCEACSAGAVLDYDCVCVTDQQSQYAEGERNGNRPQCAETP